MPSQNTFNSSELKKQKTDLVCASYRQRYTLKCQKKEKKVGNNILQFMVLIFEKRRCFAIACAKCKSLWTKLGHSRRCLEGLEKNQKKKS
jgi:hypothetical protein